MIQYLQRASSVPKKSPPGRWRSCNSFLSLGDDLLRSANNLASGSPGLPSDRLGLDACPVSNSLGAVPALAADFLCRDLRLMADPLGGHFGLMADASGRTFCFRDDLAEGAARSGIAGERYRN